MYRTDNGSMAPAAIMKKSRMNGNPGKFMSPAIRSSNLMKIFEDELKDTYWAEKALIKAIPRMIKNARSEALIAALENHLTELDEQVERLEQVFESIGKKAMANKCKAMEGLIKEAEEIMEDRAEGESGDAEIISAVRPIIQYETVSYTTLCELAETLGYDTAVDILQITLDAENAAAVKLSEVVVKAATIYEYEEMGEDEESITLFRR